MILRSIELHALPLPVSQAYAVPLLAQPPQTEVGLVLVAGLGKNVDHELQGVRAADLFAVAPEVVHVLLGGDPDAAELAAALDQDAPEVVPGALVLGRQLDLGLGVADLAVDDVAGHGRVVLGGVRARGGVRGVREDEEEAVGPGRVVAHVLVDHALDARELGGVGPHAQLADGVLPVRPDVVVLGVLGEHVHHEVALGPAEPPHLVGAVPDLRVVVVQQQLPVVPDLVVLLVLEGHLVEPGHLVQQGNVERLHDGEPVQPDRVVCRVHGDDVLGEFQAARRVFLGDHDGAEVCGCWRMSVRSHHHIPRNLHSA